MYSWYQILESTFVAYIIAVMAVVSADCRYHIATVKLLSPILITGRVCAMCFIYRPHTALNSGAECVCVCMARQSHLCVLVWYSALLCAGYAFRPVGQAWSLPCFPLPAWLSAQRPGTWTLPASSSNGSSPVVCNYLDGHKGGLLSEILRTFKPEGSWRARGGACATWSLWTMRGVFEPPIDRGAVPVTQRSPCRPSLSLSIATRHLPQAPSLPHSLTPFFCSWPGSPRHNTEAAADAWPDWLIWLWKMPFLSSTYCLRIRSPTALSHTAISFPLVSLLLSLSSFPFFLCKLHFFCFKYFVGLTVLYMILPQHQSKKQQQK